MSWSAINQQPPKSQCKFSEQKVHRCSQRCCRNTCPVTWLLHSVAWLCFFNLVISANISGFKRNVRSHSKSWGFTGWSSKWYSSSSQQLRWSTENIWKQRYKHGVRSEPEQFRWEVWCSLPVGPMKPYWLERKLENQTTLIFLSLLVASKKRKKRKERVQSLYKWMK